MPDQVPTLVVRGERLIDGRGGPPVNSGLVAIADRKILYAGVAEGAPNSSGGSDPET